MVMHVRLETSDGLFHESWQLTSAPHSARWIGTFGGGPEISDDSKREYMYGDRTIWWRRMASSPTWTARASSPSTSTNRRGSGRSGCASSRWSISGHARHAAAAEPA